MSRTLEALRRIESRKLVVTAPSPTRADVERSAPPGVCVVLTESPWPVVLPPPVALPLPMSPSPALPQSTMELPPTVLPPQPPVPAKLPTPSEPPTPKLPQPPQSPKLCWPCRTESSASYERLATSMLSQHMLDHPATLLFTSPGDSDGKTELLMAVAPMLAARAERHVLAVDADFCKSDLSTRLGAFNEGLAGLLAGTATIAEVARPTTTAHLSMLPHGDRLSLVEDDDEQFDDWEAVLDDLKCRYPLVLLDAPSLAHAHVARLGSFCDGVCLVVRLGQTPRRAAREAVQVIEANGGRLLGCIAISG